MLKYEFERFLWNRPTTIDMGEVGANVELLNGFDIPYLKIYQLGGPVEKNFKT